MLLIELYIYLCCYNNHIVYTYMFVLCANNLRKLIFLNFLLHMCTKIIFTNREQRVAAGEIHAAASFALFCKLKTLRSRAKCVAAQENHAAACSALFPVE